ncbi:MAG TPA: tRNA uridine-5-carboxymethylaminomethyl(34) synthesis GTPase MnmE [Syntrophales bacterium]|nr:tRNA uridine-5-carboxymethylaminomethyl(34) synthesis GTPase MnmE [Syntrophales bacterium]
MIQADTIAAIATPPGTGGIGIIRASGPDAERIGRALFRPRNAPEAFRSHRLYHGDILCPSTGRILDEVLVAFLRAPHSFSGEDTLEIHCHGGPLICEEVLQAVLRAGARPAGPGEFTRRAFLNGRIDLTQAEAVQEMISARTTRGLDLAIGHLGGGLSRAIGELRASVLDILTLLEAEIDFQEEDEIDAAPREGLLDQLRGITARIEELTASYGEGRIVRDGARVVITGKANVGKSSLFNRLLGEKRAIVTPHAGTTRDFIEESVTIRGIPVRFVDTAGIRESQDPIEKEGIDLVWQQAAAADVVVIVLDGSSPFTAEDRSIVEANRGRNLVVAINKCDLTRVLDGGSLPDELSGRELLPISAKTGEGLDALRRAVHDAINRSTGECHSDTVLTNLRHRLALERAHTSLRTAEQGLSGGLSPEFVAFDLREALGTLGEVTGQTVTEEVLDRIFSTFCIGK